MAGYTRLAALLMMVLAAAISGFSLALLSAAWLGLGMAAGDTLPGPAASAVAASLAALGGALSLYLARRTMIHGEHPTITTGLLTAVAAFGLSLTLGLWQAMAQREQQLAEVLGVGVVSLAATDVLALGVTGTLGMMALLWINAAAGRPSQ